VVGVEQWAEIRRMHRVERLSIREISRRTGLHRKTIRRALAAGTPPGYSRHGRRRSSTRSRTGSASSCARIRRCSRFGCGRWRPSWAIEAARRSSTTSCARSARASKSAERSSGRSIGPASWCSAICGSFNRRRRVTFRAALTQVTSQALTTRDAGGAHRPTSTPLAVRRWCRARQDQELERRNPIRRARRVHLPERARTVTP
jgi:hypothetical protein